MEDFENRPERNGRMIALMVIGGLLVIGGFLAFARWSTALANTPDINLARATYPNIVGTRIDTCVLCHTASIPNLNPYGAAYSAGGRGLASSLTNIQNVDSDGDGFTNIQEIASLTFPGDPNDHPMPPTATPTATTAPTSTSVPPTATSVPPTATNVPPTATNVPPTATSVPPTATKVPPTATAVPPTATGMPPTATGLPPTATVPPVGAPPPTATAQPKPTDDDEHHGTPTVQATRLPEPTDDEEHHATPTPGASRTPSPTLTPGCRIDDSRSYSKHSSYGQRFGSTFMCTPVPGDDSKNILPVKPNRTKQHSQTDNFGVSVSNAPADYLDVPQW